MTTSRDQLISLADKIGEFIAYWGFKKIHGQIWLLCYLSSQPVSAGTLIKNLKVSKALVSLAIKDLMTYDLIRVTSAPEKKIKTYTTNPDVLCSIKKVLQTREQIILNQINEEFLKLQSEQTITPPAPAPGITLSGDRLHQLGEMISIANLSLNVLLNCPSLNCLSELEELKLAEQSTHIT
jgi:hypothetical protein